jgi:hypothetical protein
MEIHQKPTLKTKERMRSPGYSSESHFRGGQVNRIEAVWISHAQARGLRRGVR